MPTWNQEQKRYEEEPVGEITALERACREGRAYSRGENVADEREAREERFRTSLLNQLDTLAEALRGIWHEMPSGER